MPHNKPSEPQKSAVMAELKTFFSDARLMPIFIYLLLFFMVMSLGFSGVLGIVLIYLIQDRASPLVKSHYQFQKRTFWGGIVALILIILSLRLNIPTLSYALIIPTFLWITGRCVIGFNHLFHHREHPKPDTFFA